MKILYDCFSCSPYYGSDEGIGWMWPYLMSKHHEVWALVRKDRRQDIERYCNENNVHNIHFVYCDIPDWMNFYYKRLAKNKNGAIDFLAYQFLWQFPAYKTAKKLNKEIHFDIVHHVSTNDFRLIGFLYKLKTHYLIGPIGGAQETAPALKYYVRNYEKSEKLRTLLNKLMIKLPGYKKALNRADKIYFSNPETRDFLTPYIKDISKCELMTEIGHNKTSENGENLSKCETSREAVFMWAGRMEYRKGLELLVDVLKELPLNLNWKVVLCGDGSQREYIEKLCSKEMFSDRVEFCGKLPYEQVQALYNRATAFVFPSLRETTGTVIIEAMSNGVPVICLKQGGGAMVVTNDSGYLIDGNSKEEYIKCFADAMLECITSPEIALQKGRNARQRILAEYCWEDKIKYAQKQYQELLKGE